MDENSKKIMNVSVNGILNPGDVGPGMSVAYACLCVPIWANAMGFGNTEGFALTMGVVQLGYFVLYLVCGMNLLKCGNTLSGGVYVIFSAAFGLFGGLGNIGTAVSALKGIPYDGMPCAVAFLVAGIYMFFMLPCVKNSSKGDFLVFFGAGVGVTAFGFAGLGVLAPALDMVGGFGVLVSGLSAFWCGVAGFLKNFGVNIPCGTPFFK